MTDETPVEQTAAEENAADTNPSAQDAYLDALRQVIDPELMINIVDLGLVYEVGEAAPGDADASAEATSAETFTADTGGKKVAVQMTLTSPACPAGPQIVQQAKMALERLATVDEATITLVMSPPWSPDRMTDDARDQLGIF